MKGAETEPRYESTRMLFLMMMLTSVVLFENFGASYTSFLSVVSQSKPFDSVEELYSKTEYKIGDKGGTNQKINFKVITSSSLFNLSLNPPCSTRNCPTVKSWWMSVGKTPTV